VKLGDTFLPRFPSAYRHLFIVVYRAKDECLAVNFTTKTPDSDCSCEVGVGDHSFFKHPSVVRYDGELPWFSEKTIEEDSRYLIEKHYGPASDALLDAVLKGALKSKYASGKLKKCVQKSLDERKKKS
jgi:hypothetical protein